MLSCQAPSYRVRKVGLRGGCGWTAGAVCRFSGRGREVSESAPGPRNDITPLSIRVEVQFFSARHEAAARAMFQSWRTSRLTARDFSHP
jgi:hypothetical protein